MEITLHDYKLFLTRLQFLTTFARHQLDLLEWRQNFDDSLNQNEKSFAADFLANMQQELTTFLQSLNDCMIMDE